MLSPVVVAMDACRPSVLLLWLLQSISRVTAVAASGVEYCQRLPHEATLLCTEAIAARSLQVHCLSNVWSLAAGQCRARPAADRHQTEASDCQPGGGLPATGC